MISTITIIVTYISITIFIATISSSHFDHQKWIRNINFIQLDGGYTPLELNSLSGDSKSHRTIHTSRCSNTGQLNGLALVAKKH